MEGHLLSTTRNARCVQPLPIFVTKGTAEGNTTLSAFDGALGKAGISNCNLIRLSSVIPLGVTKVIIGKPRGLSTPEKFGNRLYVVYARQDEKEPGKQACAGLGWALTTKDPRYGLFIEHEGRNKKDIVDDIHRSLLCMIERREKEFRHSFGKIQYLTSSIVCKKNPVCAVVVAVYKDEPW